MLDANPATLAEFGTVTIGPRGDIVVAGFGAEGGTCRDVAALAAVWAIGHLQRELMKTLEAPGLSDICVD